MRLRLAAVPSTLRAPATVSNSSGQTPAVAPDAARPFASALRLARLIPLRRTLLTLVCLVLAGVAEGVSLVSLLPLITLAGSGSGDGGGAGKLMAWLSSHGLEPSIGLFAGALVTGVALKAALTLVAMRHVGRAIADVTIAVRLQLIEAVLNARWGYYVRQPVGRFSNAIGGEASQAGEAYNQTAQFVADLVQIATYLVVVFFFSWKVGLLSIGVGLLMSLTLNRFVSIAKRTARRQTRHVRSMTAALTDLLVGIKPMKAMGRQARFQSLFERDAQAIRKAQRKQAFARHANKALQEPILAVCLAVGVYVALEVWRMPPGEVLVMTILLARTVIAIGKAQQGLQQVRIAEAGWHSVSETIALAQAAREHEHGGAAPTFERGAELSGVTFAYEDSGAVIRDVSFAVPKGRITTLTGSSGAGKTTTVDILLGLNEPSSGEVLVDGAPLARLDLGAWRRMTGYVPQELTLFHDTLLANVTLGQPEFDRADVERALEAAGAAPFVRDLPEGLDTVVGERGARLSGGQRQRIAIARALVHRPKLLILDEATTALDPETEANIVRNVVALARSTGLTVLAISHQPAWAEAADHVVHLAHGGVARIDSRA
ncbi:ABC transporter permease [Methylopila jiangsuensis]|uniref:ABC transporter permease n=1 Tax=Methylopila jiangsuensis TaxID=586230 RepID=A0A9W6JG91_9HYPH|nr:ABC transporter ATP-binding protein [Methylopila jiangsuensis]MDR6286618.1 ATP-binding cassette subfamily C protein [Methylopila jiangsuensis]GLK77040.1 ABC transporter permease [Methylopila jiangsuensis]